MDMATRTAYILRCFPFPLHFLAASAGSEVDVNANRSKPTDESLVIPPTWPSATPASPTTPSAFTRPFREEDVAEGEGTEAGWRDALTISRPPRAGRSERQAEEDQVDRCRSFVEGDPPRTSCTAPSIPVSIRRTLTARG